MIMPMMFTAFSYLWQMWTLYYWTKASFMDKRFYHGFYETRTWMKNASGDLRNKKPGFPPHTAFFCLNFIALMKWNKGKDVSISLIVLKYKKGGKCLNQFHCIEVQTQRESWPNFPWPDVESSFWSFCQASCLVRHIHCAMDIPQGINIEKGK